MENNCKLIISNSEDDANMFYVTRTVILDDFIYLEKDNKRTIYVSPSWFNSAKQEFKFGKVINYSKYDKYATRNFLDNVIAGILKENKVKNVLIPSNLKIKYAQILNKFNIDFKVKSDPFFEKRYIKTKEEIENIKISQKVAEKAIAKVIYTIKKAKIRKDGKLEFEGKILTRYILERIGLIEIINNDCQSPLGCMIFNTFDLFEENKEGFVYADKSIIIDIGPKSTKGRYFADMTRTVVKGKASKEMKEIYNTVLAAQNLAINRLKPGLKARDIHRLVSDYFISRGYKTEQNSIAMQGFTHGLGHGVGLNIHEKPELNLSSNDILEEGNVITIEPGLYYQKIGGVRLEDLLLITKSGCKNLTDFPKQLEI